MDSTNPVEYNDYYSTNEYLINELKLARRAIGVLQKAIMDEGSHPLHHRQVMARHRKEWAVLWRAIDKLVKTTKGDKQ